MAIAKLEHDLLLGSGLDGNSAVFGWALRHHENVSTKETWDRYKDFFGEWYEKVGKNGNKPLGVMGVSDLIQKDYGSRVWMSVGLPTLEKQLDMARGLNVIGTNCQFATLLMMCHATKQQLPYFVSLKSNTRHPVVYVQNEKEKQDYWTAFHFPWEGMQVKQLSSLEIKQKKESMVGSGWVLFEDPVDLMRTLDCLSITSHLLADSKISLRERNAYLNDIRLNFIEGDRTEFFDKQRESMETALANRGFWLTTIWNSITGRLRAKIKRIL